MGIIGAVLGDIAGSLAEFKSIDVQRNTIEYYKRNSVFTDDTIQSIAIKRAILEKRAFFDVLMEMGRRYLYVGFGGNFQKLLDKSELARTDSYANGSAMRVSFIGTYFETLKEVERVAKQSAICTHNSLEAIKGATVTAGCVYLAERGASKNDILDYAYQFYHDEYRYHVKRELSDYRDDYKIEVRCDYSVPVAIRCFYESDDFLTTIRKVHYIGGDTDTIGAISGGIAESYYKKTGLDTEKLLRYYLDDTLYNWVMK